MSVRFDVAATSSYFSRASVIDYNSAYTWMYWIKLDSDVNAYSHCSHVGGTYTYDAFTDSFGTDSDGTTSRLGIANTGGSTHFPTGSALSIATWTHIAVRRSSTTLVDVLINGSVAITSSGAVDVSAGPRTAASLMTLGSYHSLPMDGLMADVKIWTAALDNTEVNTEKAAKAPVRSSNLWCYLPMDAGTVADCALDSSGNARDWTVNNGGSLSVDSDYPSVTGGEPAIKFMRNRLRPRIFGPGIAR